MEQEKIRELLDKFYQGNTSAEEEAQLKSLLAEPAIASSLIKEYGYLAEMSPEVPEPSEGFYARLDAVTRRDAEMVTRGDAETTTGMAPIPGEEPQTLITPLRGDSVRIRMSPRRSILRYAMGIAAAAAILTGAWMLFNYMGRMAMQDTYNDPEIAMAEVRSILMTVSEKMTTGTEPLGSINSMNIAPGTLDELGKINNVVGESLSRLRYLDRVTGSQQNKENN